MRAFHGRSAAHFIAAFAMCSVLGGSTCGCGPARPEQIDHCNGLDDNGNGLIDETGSVGCGAGRACIAGRCQDPGGGYCGDDDCDTSEESCAICPSDCGACTGGCGDGVCGSSETCVSCPADCDGCVECGDGDCDAGETCSNCSTDCGPCSYCGDGDCDASETCSGCSTDCGACSYCGDGSCDADETCTGCSTDCGGCGASCTPCTDSSDCAAGTYCSGRRCDGLRACFTSGGTCPVISGYMCPPTGPYQSCTGSTECGTFAICTNYTGGPLHCLPVCTTDADCVSPSSTFDSRSLYCDTTQSVCVLPCTGSTSACPGPLSCRPYGDGSYGYCG